MRSNQVWIIEFFYIFGPWEIAWDGIFYTKKDAKTIIKNKLRQNDKAGGLKGVKYRIVKYERVL